MQQSTIARSVACRGTGLHCGEDVSVTLCPASANTGVVFVSLGGAAGGGDVEVPANLDSLFSSSRATTLAVGGSDMKADRIARGQISTVEHLLAALLAFQIDNVRIEVSGREIPAMDGSAAPFVKLIRSAGRESLAATRRVLVIEEPLEIRDGDRSIRVEPNSGLRMSYTIDFAHPCIGQQFLEIPSLDEEVFERDLAGARTFGFEGEVTALRAAGLALGGSLDNTLVLGEDGLLNRQGLRWPDEFVRHKIIDLIGDLSLLGVAVNGHFMVERGGHRLHHQMVRALSQTKAMERLR